MPNKLQIKTPVNANIHHYREKTVQAVLEEELGLSETEENYLDGATAGTQVAEKAVVTDSNVNSGISKVTELHIGVSGSEFNLFASASPVATGSDSGNSTAITAQFNAVSAADGTKGVILPVAAVDRVVFVVNLNTTNVLKVYAITASQINSLGSTVAYEVTAGQIGVFIGRSTTLWNVADASDTVTGLTASAAELNLNDDAVAGTVVASKTMVADAQKAVDVLRATDAISLGGTGVPGAATVQTEITKAVTTFTDTTAKDVFTVTIPNTAHAAIIEVDCLGVTGAGGAVGAGESAMQSKYQLCIARTAGVAAVVGLSSAIGGASAAVSGADALSTVIVTASAMSGADSAEQTFTIKVAITKGAGSSDNHTLVATARILNGNASGITIA